MWKETEGWRASWDEETQGGSGSQIQGHLAVGGNGVPLVRHKACAGRRNLCSPCCNRVAYQSPKRNLGFSLKGPLGCNLASSTPAYLLTSPQGALAKHAGVQAGQRAPHCLVILTKPRAGALGPPEKQPDALVVGTLPSATTRCVPVAWRTPEERTCM